MRHARLVVLFAASAACGPAPREVVVTLTPRQGLGVGSPVLYGAARVGEVRGLEPTAGGRVRVRAAVDAGVTLRAGDSARGTTEGLTGRAVLLITPGPSTAGALPRHGPAVLGETSPPRPAPPPVPDDPRLGWHRMPLAPRVPPPRVGA